MNSTQLTIRLTGLTGTSPSALESLKIHLGRVATGDSRVAESSPGKRSTNLKTGKADTTFEAADVNAFLERVRSWHETHPTIGLEVIDSSGNFLLKLDPAAPKIAIDPIEHPDHIPDASFKLELRVSRTDKPSKASGHIPDGAFRKERRRS
jgi:hypothetical protein